MHWKVQVGSISLHFGLVGSLAPLGLGSFWVLGASWEVVTTGNWASNPTYECSS